MKKKPTGHKRLEEIIQHLGEGVIYQEADGKILLFNQAAQRIFGLSEDEAYGRTSTSHDWHLVNEDGSPCPGEEHPSMITLRTGQALNDQIRGIARPDQPVTWLSISTRPIIGPGQESPEAVVVSFSDITERKHAERELLNSEERYRGLFNGINSGVAVYEVFGDGQDFIFKDFNSSGEFIDGQSREDLVGRSIIEARRQVEEFGLLDAMRRVWRSGKPEHLPVTLYEDDRLIGWYENYIYKLPSGEIVAIFDDATERKQTEEELRRNQKYLQKSQRIAKLGSWRLDVNTNEVYWTEELYRMYGFDHNLPPPPYTEHMKLFTPESWELLSTSLAKTVEKRGAVRVGTGDGKTRWQQWVDVGPWRSYMR